MSDCGATSAIMHRYLLNCGVLWQVKWLRNWIQAWKIRYLFRFNFVDNLFIHVYYAITKSCLWYAIDDIVFFSLRHYLYIYSLEYLLLNFRKDNYSSIYMQNIAECPTRDTSQRGDYENFRNAYLNGRSIHLTSAWFLNPPKVNVIGTQLIQLYFDTIAFPKKPS
jgi:hypothetical protein